MDWLSASMDWLPAHAFGIHGGVKVNTYVKRLAGHLGLTRHQDPRRIEPDLMGLVPRRNGKTSRFA